MGLIKKKPEATRLTCEHLSGLDLEEVSNAYGQGGTPYVRTSLGLENWPESTLDELLARALQAFPLDYEQVAIAEGMHDGLVARAHLTALRSTDSREALKAAELSHKIAGRLQDQKSTMAEGLEAMSQLMQLVLTPRAPSELPAAPGGRIIDVTPEPETTE